MEGETVEETVEVTVEVMEEVMEEVVVNKLLLYVLHDCLFQLNTPRS